MATAGEPLAGEMAALAAGVDRTPAEVRRGGPGEEAEWLAGLVHQHLRRVFSVLYRVVGNRADAQDLSQDVFLKAYERRGQLRDPGRVLPWLLRIASNAAIDFQRSRTAQGPADSLDDSFELRSPELSPEHLAVREERERRLHQALRRLGPKERAAIVLRDLEGLSGAEVAQALGCSQITVRTHIASARIKLRRYLKEGARC
jgi:RNA polymerase sigma-70 factor (ECF subfamily)